MVQVTLSDVARQSGMSVSTVSQALNNKGRISEPTKRLVRQVADQLGYIPDSRARSMRSSRSRAVGLLVPDIRNPYFSELVYAVQDQLYERGYAPLIGLSSCHPSRAEEFYKVLLSRHIDGLIVVPDGPVSPMLKVLLDHDIPVVFADRPGHKNPSVPLIDSDPREGLAEALRVLETKGYKRVAFVPGPEERSYTFRERELAFRTLVAAHPGMRGLVVKEGFKKVESTLDTMSNLISQGIRAFIFGYSGDAIRAVGVCNQRHDWQVNACLVSFDDLELFALVSPQVSVISQQVDKMGRKSVNLILSLIESDQVQKPPTMIHERLKTIFIPRGLLAPAPC